MLLKEKLRLTTNTYRPTIRKKPVGTGIFLNVNALYAAILNGKLPVGEFFELSKEVATLDIDVIDLNAHHCYAVVIDSEIPDEIKQKPDKLPMSISHELIYIDLVSDFVKELIQLTGCNFNKHKSLNASHKSHVGYLISLNL